MSITSTAIRKTREVHADRKSRQCPARPRGKRCTRTVAKNAGPDATCGRPECAKAKWGL